MPDPWRDTQPPAAALALKAAFLGSQVRRLAGVLEEGEERDNAARERDQARLVPRPPYGFDQEPQLDELLADTRAYLDGLGAEVRRCHITMPAGILTAARVLDEAAGHLRRTAVAVARALQEEPRSAEPADEYLQLAQRVVQGLHVRLASSPPATVAQIPECGIAIQEALTELRRLWDLMPPQAPLRPTPTGGGQPERDASPGPPLAAGRASCVLTREARLQTWTNFNVSPAKTKRNR